MLQMLSTETPALVSVIMPCFNSEKTLKQAVDSVLNQTFQSFELIVVDDGSTDNSYKILTEFAYKDSRVKVFKNEKNLGLMITLNKAISLASSDYLARLDSDDEMLPTRLEKQKKFLDENPDIAAVGSWYFFMGRSITQDILFKLPVTPEDIQRDILKENPICHPSVMMRKSLLQEVGGYRSEFKNSEDYDLWLRLTKTYKVANIPEPLIRYRLSLGGNSIARQHEMRIFHELAKESYLHPEKPLSELKQTLENSAKSIDMTNSLPAFYWELSKTLFRLGWYELLPKTLMSLIKAYFL